MNYKSLLAAGVTVAALAGALAPVAAQDASSSAPPVSAQPASTNPTAPPQQNWLKICEPTKDGQRACVLRQIVMTQNRQFLGAFLLKNNPSEESRLIAVAMVPLGVLLPFGVTWQIDNNKPVRVPYMLCDVQSCSTQLVVNESYVNSLKKGSKLTLTAKSHSNQDLVITFDLSGFTGVYDGDAALTLDEVNKAQTGENALEKILADRAEAARQKLEGGASSSQPPAQ